MATFIDGIAASENIDSSGEKLLIAGMDISSLDKTGTFNWEHKKDVPAQSVGKILKAKKIFTEEDCENEREMYFWQKCQTPFVYVMGELFDEYCDSSKHLAGMFQYDHDKKSQNEHAVVGFSIEGAKLEKQGMIITRSIARKCTVTESPCNKMAVAELVTPKKDDLGWLENGDGIFKTEPTIEVKIFDQAPRAFTKDERDLEKHASILGIEPMHKALTSKPGQLALVPPHPKAAAPAALPARTNNPGSHLGTTSAGHKIFSHARTHEYEGFSSKDHNEAANFHYSAAQAAKDPKIGAHHFQQVKMHMQAAGTAERKESRFPTARAASAAKPRVDPFVMKKALDAGGMGASPGNVNQGAALQGESLESKMVNVSAPSKKKKKKKWTERAAEEYAKWEKREEFRSFMQKKMPNLAMGEIDAIGQTLALKKAIEAEEALEKLTKK
jgi:hypothetical protein